MVKSSDQHNSGKRTIGRRAEDFLVRDIIDHQRRLLHVGQIITSEMNLDLPDQGQIEVSAGHAGKSVTMRFHDYGVGITPENQKP